MYYHGTSTALNIIDKVLPPNDTDVLREDFRKNYNDVIFVTKSVKSANTYAEKACLKYGGLPIVYKVNPHGLSYKGNGDYIADYADIL